MKLQHIDYFFTLAETLNFTTAAEKCFITQTAMSRYVSHLEKELGVRLFERNSHNVQLTECGKLYFQGMKEICRSYTALQKQLKAVGNHYEGSLKIGIGLYEYQFVEKNIIEFIHTYPEIKIELFRNGYGDIVPWLKSGSLDILFAVDYCAKTFHQNELKTFDICQGRKVLVMNQELAERYSGRTVQDLLSSEKLITNSEDEGPYAYESIKEFFMQALGFVPPRIVQTNSQKLQFLMAQMGYGILLVPDFLIEIDMYNLIRKDCLGENKENYQLMHLVKNENPMIELFIHSIMG